MLKTAECRGKVVTKFSLRCHYEEKLSPRFCEHNDCIFFDCLCLFFRIYYMTTIDSIVFLIVRNNNRLKFYKQLKNNPMENNRCHIAAVKVLLVNFLRLILKTLLQYTV